MPNLCFIVNPTAAGGDCLQKFSRAETILKSKGVAYTALYSQYPGHASELAQKALDEGFTRVVSVGGDGTLHEIAKVLMQTDVLLGILPFGTGNDFAKAVPLRLDLESALDTVLHGSERDIDMGLANGVPYINVAGFGFDVDVLIKTEHYKKTFRNKTAYMLGLLHALLGLRKYQAKMQVDGEAFETGTMITVAGNGQYIGGGMQAAPLANVSDGLLDICIINNVKLYRLPLVLLRFLKGRHLNLRETRYIKAKELHVELTPPSPLQLDGEILGNTPVTFSILPKALKLLV